jgi:O-antigen/teichoic acid export membrane protein
MMPQETFGQFKVVMAFLGVVSAFCFLGTSQAAVMSASKGADGNLALLLRGKFLANIGGAILILGGAAYFAWLRNSSGPVAIALMAAALFFPLYNTSDVWIAWLNGKSEFRVLANGRIVTALLTLVSVLTFGLVGDTDVWVIVLVLVAALSAQNVFLLRKALKYRSGSIEDKRLIRLGRHATVAMLFSALLALDVLILDYYFNPGDVAIYAVALLFPDQIRAIFSIFIQTISPRMYRCESLRELWAGFRTEFLVLTLGFVFIAVLGFFLFPVMIPWLFSEKYAVAAEYGKWLWLTIGLLGSTSFLGVALTARHSLITIYATGVGYPLCLGGLYFYWIEEGVEGMVTARIVATCAMAALFVGAFAIHLWRERREASNA